MGPTRGLMGHDFLCTRPRPGARQIPRQAPCLSNLQPNTELRQVRRVLFPDKHHAFQIYSRTRIYFKLKGFCSQTSTAPFILSTAERGATSKKNGFLPRQAPCLSNLQPYAELRQVRRVLFPDKHHAFQIYSRKRSCVKLGMLCYQTSTMLFKSTTEHKISLS